jgi:hypothetical protein
MESGSVWCGGPPDDFAPHAGYWPCTAACPRPLVPESLQAVDERRRFLCSRSSSPDGGRRTTPPRTRWRPARKRLPARRSLPVSTARPSPDSRRPHTIGNVSMFLTGEILGQLENWTSHRQLQHTRRVVERAQIEGSCSCMRGCGRKLSCIGMRGCGRKRKGVDENS